MCRNSGEPPARWLGGFPVPSLHQPLHLCFTEHSGSLLPSSSLCGCPQYSFKPNYNCLAWLEGYQELCHLSEVWVCLEGYMGFGAKRNSSWIFQSHRVPCRWNWCCGPQQILLSAPLPLHSESFFCWTNDWRSGSLISTESWPSITLMASNEILAKEQVAGYYFLLSVGNVYAVNLCCRMWLRAGHQTVRARCILLGARLTLAPRQSPHPIWRHVTSPQGESWQMQASQIKEVILQATNVVCFRNR